MILIFAVLGLGLGLLCYTPNLGLWGDDCTYILMARDILAGELPATRYPPGFPALLAVVEAVCPGIAAMKALSLILFPVGLVLAYLLLARRSKPRAIAVFFLCLLSPHLLLYAGHIMAEIPYMAISMGALLLLDRDRHVGDQRKYWFGLLLAIGACYIRSMGIALVGAAVLLPFLHPWDSKEWRKGTIAGIVSVGLLLPLVWFQSGAYGGQFWAVSPYDPGAGDVGLAGLLGRIATNMVSYASLHFSRLLLPGDGIPWWVLTPAGIALTFLIFTWTVRRLWQRDVLALYLAFYLGACVLWPSVWADVRFLVPVAPLLAWAVVSSLWWFVERRCLRLVAVWFLCLAGAYGVWDLRGTTRVYPPQWQAYIEAAEWIRDYAPPDAVICARKPALMEVVSGHPSFCYLFSDEPGVLVADLENMGADAVVVDQLGFSSGARYLMPAIKAQRSRFNAVFRSRTRLAVVGQKEMETVPGAFVLLFDGKVDTKSRLLFEKKEE